MRIITKLWTGENREKASKSAGILPDGCGEIPDIAKKDQNSEPQRNEFGYNGLVKERARHFLLRLEET